MLHKIELTDNGLTINGHSVRFPIAPAHLNAILGNARVFPTKANVLFIWDDFGLKGYGSQSEGIHTLEVHYHLDDYKHAPQQSFGGMCLLNGQEIRTYYQENRKKRIKLFSGDSSGAFVVGHLSAWFDYEDGEVASVSLSVYQKASEEELPITLPLDKEYAHYHDLWQDWITHVSVFVTDNNPYYNLKHGITQENLDRVRAALPVTIPNELINFYKVHNVDYDPVTSPFGFHVNSFDYDLLPFSRIVDQWNMIDSLQFGEQVEPENLLGYDSRIKSTDYANPKWIPFAEGRNGDYLLIDTDPSEQGTYGQILELVNESWERTVVAPSLTALVEMEIAYIKQHGQERFDFIIEKEE
ncbi:SMI1/KNR4 family protein [Sphingobacterium sp. DN00404]|uniref:SMI1/KNR4 family protein n=1 Tax=Sphingobacterium micropteri TaxID=2763501 RepID=A0ABR7YJS0_9SPHI|nr:SMI1/KNR4 family protein [Sphingobacterium micropteri]MBD1431576.1 SMI1/KNR4 family protein [Sphingobacterium micropteri]